LATEYATLLSRAVTLHEERDEMGRKACTDGIKGYTWWDAMEVSHIHTNKYSGGEGELIVSDA
jgi:hypothetical protein